MRNLNFFVFSAFVLLTVGVNASILDSGEQVNIRHIGHHGTHNYLPMPADEPDVYYNSTAQQVIIDGLGVVNYYDVEITSQSTSEVVVSTSVSGSYGTIDISSLPDDDYIITIDTPLGNTYEGYFQTY